MSERADYIRGLRALADLLEQHPHLSLPYEGIPERPMAIVDDLLEALQEAEPGADDGTCGDCATGRCHGTDPDDCGCGRHNASVENGRG